MIETNISKWAKKNRVNTGVTLSLDKTKNQYVSIPHSQRYDLEYTDSFSIRMIFEAYSLDANGYWLYYKVDQTTKAGFLINYGSDGKIIVNVQGSDGIGKTHIFPAIAINTRTDLVVTYANNTVQAYYNGKVKTLESSTGSNVSASIKNTSALEIGRNTNHATEWKYFSGNISHLMIFNRVISEAEVSYLHSTNLIPESLYSSCQSYWSFQERNGLRAYDSVSQFNAITTNNYSGNTGTLNNFSLIRNGSFDDASNWSLSGSWTIDTTKKVAVASVTTSSNSTLRQIGILTAGRTYRITWTVKNYIDGRVRATLGNLFSPYYTSGGTFSFTATVPISSSNIDAGLFFENGVSTHFEADDIFVEELSVTTSKLDFYTKSVYDWTKKDVSGNPISSNSILVESKTNLPELKNCVNVAGTITIPTSTSIKAIGTGNFSMYFTQYIDNFAAGGRTINFRNATTNISFTTANNQCTLFVSDSSNFARYSLPTGSWQKGFYSFCFQKVNNRQFNLFINGIRCKMNYSGAPIGSVVANDDVPYLNSYPDLDMNGLAILNLPDSANEDYKVINFGIYNGNLTRREMLELHNNSLFNNPKTLTDWKCYYQFNTVGNTWTDLTGLNGNATATASQSVAEINSLR